MNHAHAVTSLLFPELVKIVLQRYGNKEHDRTELVIGNVPFWIDNSGSFKDSLSYDLPKDKWDYVAIGNRLVDLLKIR